jgi:hypothetical protein
LLILEEMAQLEELASQVTFVLRELCLVVEGLLPSLLLDLKAWVLKLQAMAVMKGMVNEWVGGCGCGCGCEVETIGCKPYRGSAVDVIHKVGDATRRKALLPAHREITKALFHNELTPVPMGRSIRTRPDKTDKTRPNAGSLRHTCP